MITDFVIKNAPILVVAIPLIGAFLCPLVGRISPMWRKTWVLGIVTVTSLIAILLASMVLTHGAITYVFGASTSDLTVPIDSGGIPIRIIFTVDAMSAFMEVITALVGFSVILYSMVADKERSNLEQYYTLFLLLICSVMGMVTTGDLFNFFVFIEISSMASAGLVAYRVEKGRAIEAAIKYFMVSTIAAIFFLFAIAILYGQYNALNIAMLAERLQFTLLDKIALILIVMALATKCGAVPMHFWTPDAYTLAPSSVTAMLVVTSQASLYGLFRFVFTLYHLHLNYVMIGWFLIIIGVLSMVIGVTMAIPQKDVKRLMAYHAISQTGYMLLGVGVGLAVLGDSTQLTRFGIIAMEGGIFHIINHAMYKGLLFLTAGAIIFRIGSRDMNRMGGLGHSMKYTMIFFIIGALSIAGIPPFNGFASKLLIYESVYLFNPFLAIIAMVVSILTLASFVKVFHSIFMGPPLPEYSNVKEAPLPMLIGMGILALGILLFGLFPQTVIDTLVHPATAALLNQSSYVNAVIGGV